MSADHLELLVVFGKKQNQQINKRFKRFPEISFRFSLRSKPSCCTLSKALDTSKKTPLTSSRSSNDLYISWGIASNWLTQLIWRDQIVLSKKDKHFVINETFKSFAANRD